MAEWIDDPVNQGASSYRLVGEFWASTYGPTAAGHWRWNVYQHGLPDPRFDEGYEATKAEAQARAVARLKEAGCEID